MKHLLFASALLISSLSFASATLQRIATCSPSRPMPGSASYHLSKVTTVVRQHVVSEWYLERTAAVLNKPVVRYALSGAGVKIDDRLPHYLKIEINRGRSGTGILQILPFPGAPKLVLKGLQVQTADGVEFWSTGTISYYCRMN